MDLTQIKSILDTHSYSHKLQRNKVSQDVRVVITVPPSESLPAGITIKGEAKVDETAAYLNAVVALQNIAIEKCNFQVLEVTNSISTAPGAQSYVEAVQGLLNKLTPEQMRQQSQRPAPSKPKEDPQIAAQTMAEKYGLKIKLQQHPGTGKYRVLAVDADGNKVFATGLTNLPEEAWAAALGELHMSTYQKRQEEANNELLSAIFGGEDDDREEDEDDDDE